MPLDLVQTLSDLVALPSVNPMGRSVAGPEYYEHRVTDYLERLFAKLGVPHARHTVHPATGDAPSRDNLIARIDGDVPPESGGRVLLFEAHQDTVPVEGMTIPPWTPEVKDGRLYGRGSCDIKGGMTAMLGAFERLHRERPAGRPTLIMACTVNEEYGFSGARALTKMWDAGAKSLVPRRPDAAVVAEPTGMQVVVAHKGAVRWKCHTHGTAAHSSQPQLGDNAIYKMAKVLAAFAAYQREFVPTLALHPLCGRPSLSVGTIAGGISVNTVPDRCTIEIDRRMIPGDEWSAVFREVAEFVNHYPGVDFAIEHETPYLQGTTLANGPNQAVADALVTVARESLPLCKQVGVPYGTDASTIAAAGVPSVVFGPGSIDQAHTCDEWLPLDELVKASEVLYRFACRGVAN